MNGHVMNRTETLIVGGGLAGVVAALELLDAGRHVVLVERTHTLGGLAAQAFGGMLLVDTPLQRRMRIRDSAEVALADWQRFAGFDDTDHWPRRWAQHYVERCTPDVYEWLKRYGVRFFPAVQWAERGWYVPGNTVPRYHVIWGTGKRLAGQLVAALQAHRNRSLLQILTGHRVRELTLRRAAVCGCTGELDGGGTFSVQAEHVVLASGGITGNLDKVRRHWTADWGRAPDDLLNGSHLEADGALHDAVQELGGRVTHLDRMWNYAAGVEHPQPHFPGHGLSLIPCRSALWMDRSGRRIGPEPLVTAYDTHFLVARIAAQPGQYGWQILNRRIAERELAVSGAEHNVHLRERRLLAFLWQVLRGDRALVRRMLDDCPDFISAPDLDTLAARMNALTGTQYVSADTLAREILPYDQQIARGPRFHNDDQLRRIAHLRAWSGDRVRTCRFQRILDPAAGPLIAIRTRIVTRKSLGGIQTDLNSRVLNVSGHPVPGLYAVGEAAGFGGGGASGRRSLEGNCLPACILTGQAAARAIVSAQPATERAAQHSRSLESVMP